MSQDIRDTSATAPLDRVLARSHDFSEALLFELQRCGQFAGGDREEAAFSAAELVFEHGLAVRVLFEAGTPVAVVFADGHRRGPERRAVEPSAQPFDDLVRWAGRRSADL